MAEYGFFIPSAGRTLIAGLLAGETLEISRVMVGSGKPERQEALATLEDLVAPVAQATSTTPLRNGEQVDMVVEYRSDLNGGLDTGFWLNEFGIFAMDGDEEVMIYYGTLGDFPQWVSAYNDGAIDVRRYPQFCMTTILPQFLVSVKGLIDQHNANAEAHPAIHTEINGIDARLTLLELLYNTDVTGNPFSVTFGTLDGVTVEGVHNKAQARIEF